MILQVSVCLSTGLGITGTNSLLGVEYVGPRSLLEGGGYVRGGLSGGWVSPGGVGTPQILTPNGSYHTYVSKRVVRIVLECCLVLVCFMMVVYENDFCCALDRNSLKKNSHRQPL